MVSLKCLILAYSNHLQANDLIAVKQMPVVDWSNLCGLMVIDCTSVKFNYLDLRCVLVNI